MPVSVLYRTLMCVRDPGFYSGAFGTRTGTLDRGHMFHVEPEGPRTREYW